jgi:sugar lactone lactonase YvrE
LGLCNGLGWDPGEGVFYYIDTGARTVFRRTVKRDGPGVAFARFEDGLPDGMCVEPGGDIWVALWGKGKVVRLDRKTGEMNGQVEVPVPQVSSCCLGPDQSLYITTASVGMSPDDGAAFPWSGSIFRCQITA